MLLNVSPVKLLNVMFAELLIICFGVKAEVFTAATLLPMKMVSPREREPLTKRVRFCKNPPVPLFCQAISPKELL